MQEETFEEKVIKSLDTLPEYSKTPDLPTPVKAKDNKDDTPVVEVYVMETNNDLQDLKSMLMAELAEIRDKDNFMTDGKLDKDKAELFFKRAETLQVISLRSTTLMLIPRDCSLMCSRRQQTEV